MKHLSLFTLLGVFVIFMVNIAMGQEVQKKSPINDSHYFQYEGVLSDPTGEKLTGERKMTFRIFDSSDATTHVWEESHEVSVKDGKFNVTLGKNIPTPSLEGAPYYISLSIEGEELLPRQVVGSSPMEEDTFLRDFPKHRELILIRDDDWNYWDNTPHMYAMSGGNVGIGTTNPTNGKLQVVSAGNTAIDAASTGGAGLTASSTVNNGISATSSAGGGFAAGNFQTSSSNTYAIWAHSTNYDGVYTYSSGPSDAALHAVAGGGAYAGIFQGDVGIGTTNPSSALEVNGTVKTNGFRMIPGASNGYVLTTNASGVGTWQAASGGGGGSHWTVSDSVLYTNSYWGIFRGGVNNKIYSDSAFTHVNFGVACTTGVSSWPQTNQYSTISGGHRNSVGEEYCTVGGGKKNNAGESAATVAGGLNNDASGSYASIGGGRDNNVPGINSTVSGGMDNTAGYLNSTVAGGTQNNASGEASAIGGGHNNAVSGDYATCAGGLNNITSGFEAAIAGGTNNEATNNFAFVGGGIGNTATQWSSTVAGGNNNDAIAEDANVAGGFNNISSGRAAAVAGGGENTASGDYSTVAGGYWSTVSGKYSFAAGRQARVTHPGTFVWADSTAWDYNSLGANMFSIRAGNGFNVQANNGAYAGYFNNDGTGDGLRSYANVSNGINWGAVYAINYGTSPGIYGYSSGGTAAYLSGNVTVTGTLSKGGGSFKIDHPLDPANKYLYHSFVESPDMKNIYDGVVILNGRGEATVQMPDWFDSLNRDFRYQLTPIGAPAPNLYIAEKISGKRFRIGGGDPGLEVSWQVTGIRQDKFANANRIPVEEEKSGEDRGKYLHPVAFGQSETMGIDYNEKTTKP